MAEFDTTREQQRSALHRAIWGIADDVRGAVDGWDFKMYVLGFLFYRFISEDLAAFELIPDFAILVIDRNFQRQAALCYLNL